MSLRTWLCKRLGCPQVLPAPSPTASGRGPTISCVNKSTVGLGLPPGRTFTDLVHTLQRYVDEFVAPAWGTPATLVVSLSPLPGTWVMLFLDTADVASALGYHDLTADGLPLGKVFTKTTIAAGEDVAVTASHELVEMLVDPSINLLATGSVSVNDAYAYEAADAVEERPFIPLDGLRMSNFVLPSYFEDFRSSGTFDQLGVLRSAFSLAPGGYMSVLKGGNWTQIFANEDKAKRFAREDRRQHRSELRMRKHAGLALRHSVKKG